MYFIDKYRQFPKTVTTILKLSYRLIISITIHNSRHHFDGLGCPMISPIYQYGRYHGLLLSHPNSNSISRTRVTKPAIKSSHQITDHTHHICNSLHNILIHCPLDRNSVVIVNDNSKTIFSNKNIYVLFNSLPQSDTIWRHLRQYRLRLWFTAWWHQPHT